MLSERPWRVELVLLFLCVVMVSYGAGSLFLAWFISDSSPVPLNQDYVLILGGTITFHGAVLILVVPLLREHGMTWASAFGLSRQRSLKAVAGGILAGLFSIPLTVVLAELSAFVMEYFGREAEVQAPVQALQNDPSLALQGLIFVTAVLIAPAAEEILFRGILYPTVKQLGFPRLALIGTSVLFAAAHANLMTLIPLTVLSLLLTFLYEATDNLTGPIVMHSVFNLANFLSLIHGAQPYVPSSG